MGKVMSMLARKANRFNVENRAHRVLERDKPVPAPKYESNIQDMQRALELDPQLVEKLNKKDQALDDRLKNVYVTSEDRFIDYASQRADPSKPLPLSRKTPQDFEYGYREPTRVAAGCCTLRQAMQFITDHQSDSSLWTKQRIAADYKLKEDVVELLMCTYQTGDKKNVYSHKLVGN
ncbi:PREDICTED: protein NDUFAF4 homolog isoform X2 [Rhagoletis zephyria]|uniref:protein NDUFAF4 homolog isoform X2 n=1 Tax=Rhagoletis zephyria TaxID=28612 RepID=UPI0008113737|nr:PREDICTED: protein NDUFAF4 homolog isoform X2 [Rhagoletis zephyria]